MEKKNTQRAIPSDPDELKEWYLGGENLGGENLLREPVRESSREPELQESAGEKKETAPGEKKEVSPGELHAGHRERLRDRFIQDKGFDSFQDHEMLELLLFYARSRGDTNKLAHELLDAFGSLKAVLEARPEQLMTVKGIGKEAAVLITMVVPFTRVWHRCAQETPNQIANSRDAENYCLSMLAGERTERFYVVSLNAQCNVLGRRKISEGSLSEVSCYPRMVMETALNYNAHSVLLCHNHPGGTCAPSPEDVASTMQLQRLLAGVNVLLLDHIIVAGDKAYSMVQHGDLDYRIRNR